MEFSLKDKVIVITGGLGLIGREYVKAVLEQGGIAVIADINEKAGAEAISELQGKYGSRADYVSMNITSRDSIQKALETLKQKYNKIDAVVNNAYPRNKNYGKKLEEVEYTDFCENVSLHLGGYFLVCQQFAVYFKTQGYGNIINMASIYGVIAPRFDVYDGTKMTMPVEYAAIKSAVIHLTKYFAKYYKGSDIRVNVISPGGVEDGQPQPFLTKYKAHSLNKGMLQAADLTGTLVFLLSDASQCINGQNIVVDDGFTL